MQYQKVATSRLLILGALILAGACAPTVDNDTAMARFETRRLPAEHDAIAPDGSEVRPLARLNRASMAHFKLAPGVVSEAVAHRTVEEIWYFLSGRGEMWRRLGDQEEIVTVEPGVVITLPVGTHFQLRSLGDEPLAAVGCTAPPWPGRDDEAYVVTGAWEATEEPD